MDDEREVREDLISERLRVFGVRITSQWESYLTKNLHI